MSDNPALVVHTERRVCRIHPAVVHQQLAVCPYDAQPLSREGLRCSQCQWQPTDRQQPHWRCVENIQPLP